MGTMRSAMVAVNDHLLLLRLAGVLGPKLTSALARDRVRFTRRKNESKISVADLDIGL